MPKISVIMPVYNKARYIERTINSILSQTYKDFELIIVDDGSTDGSELICDKFEQIDSRVKVFHIENSGVSNARNIGMENAKGEYIQFIDGDDILEINTFEELIDNMHKHNVDIIISGFKKINDMGVVIKDIIPKLSGIIDKKELLSNFIKEQHDTGIYGWTSCKFFKRSLIEEYKIRFNKNIKLAEDLDFYIFLYDVTEKILVLKKSFFYYLQGAENSSLVHFYNNDYKTQIEIILKEKNLIQKNGCLDKEGRLILDKAITNFLIAHAWEKYTFNYRSYKHKLEQLIRSEDIKNSITYNDLSIYNKMLIKNLDKNYYIRLYILIMSKKIVGSIYRVVKSFIEVK